MRLPTEPNKKQSRLDWRLVYFMVPAARHNSDTGFVCFCAARSVA
jgi:hypothetical protein